MKIIRADPSAYEEVVRQCDEAWATGKLSPVVHIFRSVATPREPAPGYVYLIHGVGTPWYKIGLTTNPQIRLKQLGTQGPFKLEILRSFSVDDMCSVEELLHAYFANKRANGEWFCLSPPDVDWLLSTTATTFDEFTSEVIRL